MELLLRLSFLLAGPVLVYGQSTPAQCCQTKVVTGMEGLNGEYTLAEDRGDNIEDVCNDGCVYTRDTTGDEFCFKTQPSSGLVQCETVENLESQRSDLQGDVDTLENEVNDLDADQADAENLETELDNVDTLVEELTSDVTSSGRVRRQEEPTTPLQGPTTCDEIADIIEQLADTSKTNAERLILARRILLTSIKKCVSKDKLTKTKTKIKIIKTETGVRIKIIIKTKNKKTKEIVEKTKIIIKLTIQINEIKGVTTKPPPMQTGEIEVTLPTAGETGVTTPTGEIEVSLPTGEIGVTIPTGEIGVTIPTGEVEVSIPTGEIGVTIPTGEVEVSIPTGEIGVSIKPTGEIAVSMNSTGEQAVTIKPTGEQAVTMNSTGEQAVEVKPTGEVAVTVDLGGSTTAPTGEIGVPINSTGQQAVEVKPTGQQAVQLNSTSSPGQKAIPMTEGLGQSTVVPQ